MACKCKTEKALYKVKGDRKIHPVWLCDECLELLELGRIVTDEKDRLDNEQKNCQLSNFGHLNFGHWRLNYLLDIFNRLRETKKGKGKEG